MPLNQEQTAIEIDVNKRSREEDLSTYESSEKRQRRLGKSADEFPEIPDDEQGVKRATSSTSMSSTSASYSEVDSVQLGLVKDVSKEQRQLQIPTYESCIYFSLYRKKMWFYADSNEDGTFSVYPYSVKGSLSQSTHTVKINNKNITLKKMAMTSKRSNLKLWVHMGTPFIYYENFTEGEGPDKNDTTFEVKKNGEAKKISIELIMVNTIYSRFRRIKNYICCHPDTYSLYPDNYIDVFQLSDAKKVKDGMYQCTVAKDGAFFEVLLVRPDIYRRANKNSLDDVSKVIHLKPLFPHEAWFYPKASADDRHCVYPYSVPELPSRTEHTLKINNKDITLKKMVANPSTKNLKLWVHLGTPFIYCKSFEEGQGPNENVRYYKCGEINLELCTTNTIYDRFRKIKNYICVLNDKEIIAPDCLIDCKKLIKAKKNTDGIYQCTMMEDGVPVEILMINPNSYEKFCNEASGNTLLAPWIREHSVLAHSESSSAPMTQHEESTYEDTAESINFPDEMSCEETNVLVPGSILHSDTSALPDDEDLSFDAPTSLEDDGSLLPQNSSASDLARYKKKYEDAKNQLSMLTDQCNDIIKSLEQITINFEACRNEVEELSAIKVDLDHQLIQKRQEVEGLNIQLINKRKEHEASLALFREQNNSQNKDILKEQTRQNLLKEQVHGKKVALNSLQASNTQLQENIANLQKKLSAIGATADESARLEMENNALKKELPEIKKNNIILNQKVSELTKNLCLISTNRSGSKTAPTSSSVMGV